MISTYGKWVGNTQELSRIYLEVISDLEATSKSIFWIPKLDVFDKALDFGFYKKDARAET